MPLRAGTLILCLLLVAAWPVSVAAAATLTGTVRDALGDAIPGCRTVVRDAARTAVATVATDDRGRYTVADLAPGRYQVEASFPGFATARRAVRLGEVERVELDLRLELAALAHEVTVSAEPGRVTSAGETAQMVNVVAEDELRTRAKAVVAEAVEGEVGAQVQRTSPSIAGVFVRGLGGRNVSVFVDGVRYSTAAQRGGIKTFLSLVDPSGLAGAEVLRGPQGAQYGSASLGGSLQLQSRAPALAASGSELRFRTQLDYASAYQGYGVAQGIEWASTRQAVTVDLYGRRVNPVRPGDGVDRHAAVTRFLGLESSVLGGQRLPDTGFTAYGGAVRWDLQPGPGQQLSLSYRRGQQDGGKRYDQLLGGNGDNLADLRGLKLDFGVLRYETSRVPWLDALAVSASLNRQREERVSQRGNGDPTAEIRHEPERTTVVGVQVRGQRGFGPFEDVTFGAELYEENVDAAHHRRDPVSGRVRDVRPRVPDGARFRSYGAWGQAGWSPTDDVRVSGAVRVTGASYRARAADSPLASGEPLWPDSDLRFDDLTWRLGAVWSTHRHLRLTGNLSRGFRIPSITDLGTLGLTGSGFEVAAAEVDDPGADVASGADADAVPLGIGLSDLSPETSLSVDARAELEWDRVRFGLGWFLNDIDGALEKRALVLSPDAVGTELGGETITDQLPSGVVFVAASSSPVLVRQNVGEVRVWGIEQDFQARVSDRLTLQQSFTWLRASDRVTGEPPSVSGGTPAPDGTVRLRYDAADGRWWLAGKLHGVLRQDRLSSLALQDRRIGAFRDAGDIASFFLNGATFRGLVAPGGDGRLGTADDVLAATGETLEQVTARVLGSDGAGAPLFPELPGYVTVDLQAGYRIRPNQTVIVDLTNLTDSNHRGMAWGMPGAGRAVRVRWSATFE